ncbi:hypothetical protein Hte_002055 [Hypoxylon texense]
MPEFFCREHFLCWRLRRRVEEMAGIQSRITKDTILFRSNGDDVREKFEDTREWYLQLLQLPLDQLRKIMNTSDSDISTDEFTVESIMKRVRPVPERYLERLVQEGLITQDDMDCIIVGGYTDIQDYIDDLSINMTAIGSNLTVSILLESPGTVLDANQPEAYDEKGFPIQNDVGDATEYNETDELALERTWSNSNDALLALDISTREPFDWADDVESELEILEVAEASAHEPPTTPSVTVTALAPEDEKAPSDPVSSSDASEENSVSEPEPETQESDDSSVEAAPCSPKSDQGEVPESKPELETETDADADAEADVEEEWVEVVAETEMTEGALPSNDDVEPKSPPVRVSLDTLLSSDPDSKDRDVDTWVLEYDIPYWQWEMLFTIRLAAKRYKDQFEEARKVYMVDPFRDVDWS